MFSIFRKNDPYLYVLYAVAVIVTRVLFFFFSENTYAPVPELEFDRNFYDFLILKPQSKGFGIILNGVLVLLNAVLFNQLILMNNALKESNYTPGIVFILLMSSFQEAFIYSGILLGLASLILALYLILGHVKQRASEENIFFTGLFLGLAGIAFKPFALFSICLLIIYFLYTRTIVRRYFLALFGFGFPHLIIFTVSKFTAITTDYSFWAESILSTINSSNWLEYQPLIIVPMLLIAFYELAVNYSGRKMTNHQIHFQRVITTILVYSIAIYFIFGGTYGAVMLGILPITFFVSMSIGNANKLWIREAISVLVLLLLARPYL